MKRLVALAACALTLAACSGIYGPKGNDTGGVIPWNIENESNMWIMMRDNCSLYGKTPVIRTIHRVYGDFIVYDCVFGPPREPKLFRRQI